ncbi:MAG: cytidylate kinase-like family protein, partial [Clostridiales bacterium]|nr:cytidylate kinase-like family protein [Clostridiales bacterium]
MIICIGKSCGSGGHEIGELLAKQLGYAYYDQKALESAASREIFENMPAEKDALYAQSSEDVLGEIGEAYEAGRTQFLAKNSVILQAAAKGNCVIDMNCADYVLKEAGLEYISIFITAPFEDRVERKKEELGKDAVQTMTFIKKENLR